MDEVSMAIGAVVGIVIFCWFAWITYRLEQIGDSADEANERFQLMEDALAKSLGYVMEQVKEIGAIKEYLPQFTINQNPLQGLMDAFLGNLTQDSNAPTDLSRDESGQFSTEKGEITDGAQEN